MSEAAAPRARAAARGGRARTAIVAGAAIAAAIGMGSASAAAGPLAAAVGGDYYSGGHGHAFRDVSGALGLVLGSRGECGLATALYDDNVAGDGVSVTAGANIRVGGVLRLRGLGSHIRSDAGVRALRCEIGPQVALPGGRNLSLLFVRYADNGDMSSNGMRTALDAPISDRITARTGGAFASTSAGVTALEGSIGLVGIVRDHLEISGDIGVARNGGAGAAGRPLPIQRVLDGVPIIGTPPGQPAPDAGSTNVSPTVSLGVRLLFP